MQCLLDRQLPEPELVKPCATEDGWRLSLGFAELHSIRAYLVKDLRDRIDHLGYRTYPVVELYLKKWPE